MKLKFISSLSTAVLFAVAVTGIAEARDTVSVTLKNANGEESIEIPMDELKAGESRQLVAASGKPAVVTRTENGLIVEVAGKRTEIALPDHHGMHVFHHHGDAGKLKIVQIDKDKSDAAGSQRASKVVILRHSVGDDVSDSEIAALVAEAEAGLEGDKIIIKRHIEKSVDATP